MRYIRKEPKHLENVTINWRPELNESDESYILPTNWQDIQSRIIEKVYSVKDLLPDIDDLELQ